MACHVTSRLAERRRCDVSHNAGLWEELARSITKVQCGDSNGPYATWPRAHSEVIVCSHAVILLLPPSHRLVREGCVHGIPGSLAGR